MPLRTAVLAVVLLLLVGCGDDVVDEATEAVDQASNDAVAAQLADQLVERTELARPDAECVAGEIVADLGAATVVSLVIETGGNLSQVSKEDQERIVASARAAGEACGVDAAEIF